MESKLYEIKNYSLYINGTTVNQSVDFFLSFFFGFGFGFVFVVSVFCYFVQVYFSFVICLNIDSTVDLAKERTTIIEMYKVGSA